MTEIIVGGGAAGVFAAIIAKACRPKERVLLLEKTATLLAKVRISGGGRCNVTHSCFDPKALTANYPRGGKELLGPFHSFQPRDTIAWFQKRGVNLKAEKDGRIFPVTDSSQTIIQCLLEEAKKLGVEIHLQKKIEKITPKEGSFHIYFKNAEPVTCEKLTLATGSNSHGHAWAKSLGHTIQRTLPSLFTFNCPSSTLKELSGITIPDAQLHIAGSKLFQRGPLLLTHFGFSGPTAIKLSAWAASYLFDKNYKATLVINWLPAYAPTQITNTLLKKKSSSPHTPLASFNPFSLPKNLWKKLLGSIALHKLQEITNKELHKLVEKLTRDPYAIDGKTTNKEEFVTCGGVTLSEVYFKTMESKICSGLHFAGEILDIDGVTGGFNFQNAWTTGYLAGAAPLPH